MFMPCRTLLSHAFPVPVALLKSSFIFLNALMYSSSASPGDGACDAEMVPASRAALVAAGVPLKPRMPWNVVESAPTLITAHFAGL